jgi:hypothetical protein
MFFFFAMFTFLFDNRIEYVMFVNTGISHVQRHIIHVSI